MNKILELLKADVGLEPAVQGNIWQFADKVIGVFLYFCLFLVTPLLIALSIFYFFSAAGEEEKIKKGRNLLFWTGIGLIIIISAKILFSRLADIL